jgi:hypothetical protein
MPADSHWFEKITGKFFSLFSRREVKTPLAFFFRIGTSVSVVVLVSLYLLRDSPDLLFKVFLIGIAVLIIFFMAVYRFAWVNPKHLVFGESGHRAEMKFVMGTEERELAAEEVATLQAQTNPNALPSTGSGGAP